MAFGWGVERSETYTARLEHYAGQPTYNIASPGADICGYQKLLARMPEGIIPKAIVLGVILENDIGDYNCQLREERLKDEKLANNKTPESARRESRARSAGTASYDHAITWMRERVRVRRRT